MIIPVSNRKDVSSSVDDSSSSGPDLAFAIKRAKQLYDSKDDSLNQSFVYDPEKEELKARLEKLEGLIQDKGIVISDFSQEVQGVNDEVELEDILESNLNLTERERILPSVDEVDQAIETKKAELEVETDESRIRQIHSEIKKLKIEKTKILRGDKAQEQENISEKSTEPGITYTEKVEVSVPRMDDRPSPKDDAQRMDDLSNPKSQEILTCPVCGDAYPLEERDNRKFYCLNCERYYEYDQYPESPSNKDYQGGTGMTPTTDEDTIKLYSQVNEDDDRLKGIDILDDLGYRSYIDNRLQHPEVTVEHWKTIYGKNVDKWEKQWQNERQGQLKDTTSIKQNVDVIAGDTVKVSSESEYFTNQKGKVLSITGKEVEVDFTDEVKKTTPGIVKAVGRIESKHLLRIASLNRKAATYRQCSGWETHSDPCPLFDEEHEVCKKFKIPIHSVFWGANYPEGCEEIDRSQDLQYKDEKDEWGEYQKDQFTKKDTEWAELNLENNKQLYASLAEKVKAAVSLEDFSSKLISAVKKMDDAYHSDDESEYYQCVDKVEEETKRFKEVISSVEKDHSLFDERDCVAFLEVFNSL